MKNYIKPLAAAVALAAGSTAYAQQHNNSENTGQVLMFPYYNVENSSNTYMHIHNTTGEAKAVKVRFMEFKNSAVVLEFNVYLGPYDIFPVGIDSTPEGGASVITNDNTCTIPELGTANAPYDGTKTELADGSTLRRQPFVPYQYSTDVSHGLNRTLVGHAEVIEMGVVDPLVVDVSDCSAVSKLWLSGAWSTDSTIGAPSGGLTGSSVFINPDDAYSLAIYPTAVDGWAKAGVNYHTGAGTLLPTLDQGVATASLWDGSDFVELDYSLNAKGSIMAMSALMATSVVSGEQTVESVIAAESDMVVTFPLKKYFRSTGGDAIAPFTTVYDGTKEENKQCEEVSVVSFSRTGEATAGSGTFVPEESGIPKFLCDTVNVLRVGDSSALQVEDSTKVNSIFESGFIQLSMEQGFNADDNNVVVKGLPSIGFNATRIVNGDMSYGYSNQHKTLTVTSGG